MIDKEFFPSLQGKDCETKKDFCEEFSQPCRNGATCVSVDQTYVSLFAFLCEGKTAFM